MQSCTFLWKELQKDYMPTPTTEQWHKLAKVFENLWQIPKPLAISKTFGAVDGKHINIQAPANSGTFFFKYKKTFRIVFLAVADAQYNFTIVDIGAYGSQSDGSVLAKSLLGSRMKNQSLLLPGNRPLIGTITPSLLFVIVGNEAFPLLPNLMRPFPTEELSKEKKIFNYRLSRARRVVENAFEILSSRFRCF